MGSIGDVQTQIELSHRINYLHKEVFELLIGSFADL